MEGITAFEPVVGTALGGESTSRGDARTETLHIYASRGSQHLDAGTAGHAALANGVAQLRSPGRYRIHTPRRARSRNGRAWRFRHVLRYRPTVGFPGSQ